MAQKQRTKTKKGIAGKREMTKPKLRPMGTGLQGYWDLVCFLI
jgi:hypothetical protein